MTDSNSDLPDRKPEVPLAMSGGETDAEVRARQQRAIDEVVAMNRAAAAAEAPGKFTLTELMLVITLLAVVLGLVRGLGIWGGLVVFVGCIALGNIIYPRAYPHQLQRQIVMFDVLWGIVMPLVCLACDPLLFRGPTRDWGGIWMKLHFGQEAIASYCLIVWQILSLAVWHIGRPWLKGLAGLFLGTWIVGTIFSAGLGLLLVVPATLGLAIGIGLLGFTPWFTSFLLLRRLRESIELIDESLISFPALATAGFLAAFIVPWQMANWLKLLLDLQRS